MKMIVNKGQHSAFYSLRSGIQTKLGKTLGER